MSTARIAVIAVWVAGLALGCSQKSGPDDQRDRVIDTTPESVQPESRDASLGAAIAPAVRTFATAAQAIEHVIANKPLVLGVGEFHQKTSSAPVRSTLERFIDAFAAVSRGASDLVLETWVESGACGEVEEAVSKDVQKTTERPPVVQNHLLRLLVAAKVSGLRRHVLRMECDDFARVRDDTGAVDYDKMLILIKDKLAAAVVRARAVQTKQNQTGTIIVYGGAFHNDLHPYDGTEGYSYVAKVDELVGDRYVELDLYVPEYIAGNKLLAGEAWYPAFERQAGPDRVLLIERAPRSYIVILRTGDSAVKTPSK